MIHKNWQELIKPTQLDVKPGNDPTRQATVVAEPLERGFGLTLGNAVRRVLMSSLQGAAISSIQIDNVLHEFSSVAGVREDVTDIVLNLKDPAARDALHHRRHEGRIVRPPLPAGRAVEDGSRIRASCAAIRTVGRIRCSRCTVLRARIDGCTTSSGSMSKSSSTSSEQ